MSDKVERGDKTSVVEIERRNIYLTLIIILILAIIMQFTQGQIASLLSLFLIGIIVIGNIIYLHNRFRAHIRNEIKE